MLSLGDPRDTTLEDNENAQLMPITGPSKAVDAIPVPIKLDQLNVDTAIANIVQEELAPVVDNTTDQPTDANDRHDDATDGNTTQKE